jgi:hypothetical protein
VRLFGQFMDDVIMNDEGRLAAEKYSTASSAFIPT